MSKTRKLMSQVTLAATMLWCVAGFGQAFTFRDQAYLGNNVAAAAAGGGGGSSMVIVTNQVFAYAFSGTVSGKDFSLTLAAGDTVYIAMDVHSQGGSANVATNMSTGTPGTLRWTTNSYNTTDGFRGYVFTNQPAGVNVYRITNSAGNNWGELGMLSFPVRGANSANPFGTLIYDFSLASRTSETETVTSSSGDLILHFIAHNQTSLGTLGAGETSITNANVGATDASVWASWKTGAATSTTVSSTGWPSSVVNGVGEQVKP